MKYAVKMGSGAKVHIQNFRKIGSGIQKLIGRNTQILVHRHTDTQTAMLSHKPAFI
jgi:hypothetical protein